MVDSMASESVDCAVIVFDRVPGLIYREKRAIRVRDYEGSAGLFHLVLHNRKTGSTMICARADQSVIGGDFSITRLDCILVKSSWPEIGKLRIDDQ